MTSSAARAALYAGQTSEVFLYLLTITDGATTYRLCSDVQDITSRGNVYTRFPLEVTMPSDQEGELPKIEIKLYDVRREYIAFVRSIAVPATVTVELIMRSEPDTVQRGPWLMDLVGSEFNMQEIKLILSFKPLLTEPYPYHIFSPGKFPMLFNAVRAG